ncbi:hypothetical protein CH373_06555 [Leptospira perolatii]|uniref:SbsA Ig-like domain-containing protein n=1 Tax=Leptospira perolatii TaxID=2023191 RepID=A0A2M9ZP54_9LEPT|nr:Ig-like domain-containing protein [Leptospira perolatii]PJZ70602.1 hypothetical protein CH360_03415 [Leptospira perolatii]PJZ73814.1 hypothetical protein CH373_06555 [Leptospira perolatii]
MNLLFRVCLLFLLAFYTGLLGDSEDLIPPKVISTIPENGSQTVDPNLNEIVIVFNEPMLDQSWSWAYKDPKLFPKLNGQPKYDSNRTKNLLPVKLEPNKQYEIWLNTEQFQNFRDKAGNPLVPYVLKFKTK